MRIRKQTAVIVALTGVTGFLLGAIKDQSPITRGMLTQSEKVVGLQFTAAEKDSMIDDLADNLESYNELRAIYIDNSVPPSLQFNPVPVGKKFEKKRRRFVTSPPNKIAVPENLEELAFHSVRDLAELIRKRKITSTQLTRMYLDRLKKHGPKLECVVTLTEELALAQARRADKEIASGKYRGYLHGIPYGAKDLLAVKGYKTTWGAEPYKEQIIEQDDNDDKAQHRRMIAEKNPDRSRGQGSGNVRFTPESGHFNGY